MKGINANIAFGLIPMDVDASITAIIVMHVPFFHFADFGIHQSRVLLILPKSKERYRRYRREPLYAWEE